MVFVRLCVFNKFYACFLFYLHLYLCINSSAHCELDLICFCHCAACVRTCVCIISLARSNFSLVVHRWKQLPIRSFLLAFIDLFIWRTVEQTLVLMVSTLSKCMYVSYKIRIRCTFQMCISLFFVYLLFSTLPSLAIYIYLPS